MFTCHLILLTEMTQKISKSTGKSKPLKVESNFTVSENFLIDQLEGKKKKKHAPKESEDGTKMGKMFKKKAKAEPVSEDDMEEEVPEAKKVPKHRTKVVSMEMDGGDVPGFSAPKPAKKRTAERTEVKAKKAKVEVKKEVSKKELKVERKKKENASRYDLSIKAKKIWEELRREETPKDKQLALSAELFGLVKGHTKEVIVFILNLYCNRVDLKPCPIYSWCLPMTLPVSSSVCSRRLHKKCATLSSTSSRVTPST